MGAGSFLKGMNASVDDYPLIAIVGPTAAGKSALALVLAERLAGEVMNYDSVQFYRGFDVGSGKLPPSSGAGWRTTCWIAWNRRMFSPREITAARR